jgi:glyoxylase-like metal-dependent hydrolase (beta-lactamase superfamily II)
LNSQAQSSGKAPHAVLENASKAIGADGLKSIKYSGNGFNFALGQSPKPFAPWPKFNVKSYTRTINFETASSQEEMVRTQYENPPHGGGAQPIIGEQRQVQLISGAYAWNLAGNNATPAPAAATERMLQIWTTPHGFLKAAQMNKATVRPVSTGKGRKMHVASFLADGKFKINGFINDQNLVERVETWIPNPVVGDMLVETLYSNYQDLSGIKFPTRIVQKQAGFPTLDISVMSVEPNAAAAIEAPSTVRQASAPPVRVESQKLAEGVWYLTGGSHHSALVEFKDHLTVIEAPLNEERSLAVISEVKKLVPNKPIKYLVMTHHHFDHSGGVRTFVAVGATVVTHRLNKAFCDQILRGQRTLSADKLSQARKAARVITMADKYVMTDGTRVVELHHIKGSMHNEGIIMGYLPAEKLLIEADVFTPGAVNAPPPATPNPFTVNLNENLQRLNLAVDRIAIA